MNKRAEAQVFALLEIVPTAWADRTHPLHEALSESSPITRAMLSLWYGTGDSVIAAAVTLAPHVTRQLGAGVFPMHTIRDLILWNCGHRTRAQAMVRIAEQAQAGHGGDQLHQMFRLASRVAAILNNHIAPLAWAEIQEAMDGCE